MTTEEPDEQGKTTRIPRVEQPVDNGGISPAPEAAPGSLETETDPLEPPTLGAGAPHRGGDLPNLGGESPGLGAQFRDPAGARPVSAATQQDVVFVPLAVNVGDGFKFGCGFFLAFVLAMLIGFVLLAALFVLASVFGLNVPITR